MSADQLRESASVALREQRLYAPAGNNAMEYYLALRDKAPSDPAVASALTDLMPYALIATEQSIQREDFVESQRLYALMEKTDATRTALPRLKQTIAQQQQAVAARAEQDKVKTEEDAKRQAELEKTAPRPAAGRPAAGGAAARRPAGRAGRSRQEGRRRSRSRRRTRSASSRRRCRRSLHRPRRRRRPRRPVRWSCALSTPGPALPGRSRASQPERRSPHGDHRRHRRLGHLRARRRRHPAARLRSAKPSAAVKKWKFAPIDAPVTTTRTINFRPGG
jgi:protein TonB